MDNRWVDDYLDREAELASENHPTDLDRLVGGERERSRSFGNLDDSFGAEVD